MAPNLEEQLIRRQEHIALLATMIYAAEIQVPSVVVIATSYCVDKALDIIKEAEKQTSEA